MRQRLQVFGCQLSEELLLVLQGMKETLLIKKREIQLHQKKTKIINSSDFYREAPSGFPHGILFHNHFV